RAGEYGAVKPPGPRAGQPGVHLPGPCDNQAPQVLPDVHHQQQQLHDLRPAGAVRPDREAVPDGSDRVWRAGPRRLPAVGWRGATPGAAEGFVPRLRRRVLIPVFVTRCLIFLIVPMLRAGFLISLGEGSVTPSNMGARNCLTAALARNTLSKGRIGYRSE